MRTRGRGVVLVSIVLAIVLGIVSSVLAAGGTVAWTQRFNGPANGTDQARDVAVSPDSKTVYIYNTLDFSVGVHDAVRMTKLADIKVCDPPKSHPHVASHFIDGPCPVPIGRRQPRIENQAKCL
jgi:hypothetical protein